MTTSQRDKFNRIVLEKETSFGYLTTYSGTMMLKYFHLFLLGVLFSAEGCQVYNEAAVFIGQRYTNTVAYFNTYYNAQTAFDAGEKEVLDAEVAQMGKPISTAPEAPLSQAGKDKFNLAIEKASKLLSYYPTSKWVDDALLMIGKSYYYLGDDLKAERKFLELFGKFPNSDLRFEAELWYGRSLIRQKRNDEGVQTLQQLYSDAMEKKENRIAGLASFSLGKYYDIAQDYEKAVKYFQQSLKTSDDDRLNAETELQMGFCYIASGDDQKASLAFTGVQEYDPEYATSFAAILENVKILVRSHQYDEALKRLESLLSNAKNMENFSKIHLEIGRIYIAQNRMADAIAKFSYVDTAYKKTDDAAKAYYTLGNIYETMQIDYAKAGTNYGKAKAEFPASSIADIAAKKAEAFEKYFGLYSDIRRDDSLTLVMKGRKAKRDSLALAADTLHLTDSVSFFSHNAKASPDSQGNSVKLLAVKDSLARLDSLKKESNIRLLAMEVHSIDSLRQAIVRAHFELAGVFYLDLERQDSALYWYRKVIDEGEGTEYAARAMFTVAEIFRTSGANGKESADSLYSALIAQYPESPYAQESRRILGLPLLVAAKDTAEELYLRAETLFDSANTESALPFLYKIVEEHHLSPYSPKALYAIGWLYENKLEKEDSASITYRRLIAAYPTSQYALAVMPRVQEEDNERKDASRRAAEDLSAKKKKEAEKNKKEQEEKR
ncbi:MAG: tetratricopeptide repeat protein [Bacteroidota bacterium]